MRDRTRRAPPCHPCSSWVSIMTTRYVGLHIGRTAGTSFYHYVESALGIGACLPISTFTHDIQRGRLTALERIDSGQLPVFTYGHYVHESWFEFFRQQGDAVVGFSFYRDPVERRVSLLRHAVALDQTREGSDFASHLDAKDIWCQEVLRCFPTASQVLGDQPTWKQALLALSTLDYLLPMEQAADAARLLVERVGRVDAARRFPELNPSRPMTATSEERTAALDEQDLLLYEAVQGGQRASEAQVQVLRAAIAQRYSAPGAALDAFRRHLLKFMRSELRSHATTMVCVEILKARRRSLDDALAFLEVST